MQRNRTGIFGVIKFVACFSAAAIFVVGCEPQGQGGKAVTDNKNEPATPAATQAAKVMAENEKNTTPAPQPKVEDPNAPQLQKLLHDTSKKRLQGYVTTFSNSIAGIDIGFAHGVKQGMKMAVFHGNKFIGRIVIDEVDGTYSAGDYINRKADPVQGDFVIEE